MGIKALDIEHEFTLTITMTTDDGSMAIDPDDTPTAAITDSGDAEVATLTVSKTSTGIFTTTWTPTATGEFTLTWSFEIDEDSYTDTESIVVLDVTTETESEDGEAEPDVGSSNVCALTATFIDASGDYVSGVYVRFSPDADPNKITSSGAVVSEATGVSDDDGAMSLNVVRGITGLLTIAHIGIVRRVTIPDQVSKDMFELAAEGIDLLEVQEEEFFSLPRRS